MICWVNIKGAHEMARMRMLMLKIQSGVCRQVYI